MFVSFELIPFSICFLGVFFLGSNSGGRVGVELFGALLPSPACCARRMPDAPPGWTSPQAAGTTPLIRLMPADDYAPLEQHSEEQRRSELRPELQSVARESQADFDSRLDAAHERLEQLTPTSDVEAGGRVYAPSYPPSSSAANALDGGVSLPESVVASGFDAWAAAAYFEFDALLPHIADDEEAEGSDEASRADQTGCSEPPSWKKQQLETQNLRDQLEDLQMTTISGLVESVRIDVEGQSMEKKLLVLSTKQAMRFDMGSLPKVLSAMDVTPPKLVISVFASGFEAGRKNLRSMGHISHPESSIVSSHAHSEANEWELLSSLRRVEAFMEDIVLPIAVQTRALVIVENANCRLGAAFSKVCMKYAKSRGGKLPFTLISFNCTNWMRGAVQDPDSTATALKNASKRWDDCPERPDQESFELMTAQDLLPGCTHTVMVAPHGLPGPAYEAAQLACRDLRAEFVNKLTAELPSIAIGSFSQNPGDGEVVDYISRDLPVLLLDSRPPPRDGGKYSYSFGDMQHDLLELEARLVSNGCTNQYDQFAHLNAVLKNVLKRDQQHDHGHATAAHGDSVKWIWNIVELSQKNYRA